ncbi:MAG: crossover junction endodeoxyribonuclease RuvC [Terrimonas sp.]|nr:crossover junction endodeoxyribonuclease RuvC [Terrimonas sp.]
MGYGVIRIKNNQVELLELGALKPGTQKDIYKRLQMIYETVCGLIIKYKPDEFAIEAPFFGKNVQSMLKLGRAQGVAIAAAMGTGIPVTEYSPKKVKQSITGNGNANKEQVWKMLQTTFLLDKKPRYYDATDALAVSLCHHYQQHKIAGTGLPARKSKTKKGSWAAFVAKHPHKVI